MSKVTMTGSFECQAGKTEEMVSVLKNMVKAAAAEPGCEIYSYHRGEGNTFWFFALMTDEAAMQQHGQSDAMKQAMASFMPLVAGPPSMSSSQPIAALGLPI